MKKYKQIPRIQELQQKLDRTYGKGLYKAGFVLLLFCCLFFTSCASDSRSTSFTRVGVPETTTTTSTTSSEARIKITDTNQTNSPNNLYGSEPAVLDAYFAREDTESGAYKRINSAAIGDTVFIVVDTANLSSRTIKVTIKDENKIIKNKIPFLQYKTKDDNTTFEEKPVDVSGEFSSKVRNDKNDQRFALYKIDLKAKDDKITTQWKEDIKKHKDKKLMLYLTVTVDNEDNVIYCGSNFKDENQRATDKENNVWLNMDKKWFEVNPSSCFCNRDLKVDEMIKLIYHLRDKENFKTYKESFFNKGSEYISSIRILSGKIIDNKDKVSLFTKEMNSMFQKFKINTCKRKIHFLSQMYLETTQFRSTYENRSSVPENYKGGVDFQGRGMKQITHDYNYLAYYDYINNTTLYDIYIKYRSGYESVGECVKNRKKAQENKLTEKFYSDLKTFAKKISEDLFHAFNSAGWFSTIHRSDTLIAMDKGLTDSDVKIVTKKINGGENNLAERQNYAKWIKEFIKYDTDCPNK